MKILGIITEYNPFHNGHQLHIEEAKKKTNADYVIVVMSGNFVQRGGPAIIHKYARCEVALKCGADLVFELPVIYSTASAEFFALGAISLLDQLGIVDYVCFGSESGDIEPLTSIANYLALNEDQYNKDIKSYLKEGLNYPKARQKSIVKNNPSIDIDTLKSPNNILGIEYIKAIIKLNSKIEPVTIKRQKAAYHQDKLSKITGKEAIPISSATAIRKSINKDSSLESIKDQVPKASYNILKNELNKTFPIYNNDLGLLVKYKLLIENSQFLNQYIDVTCDLANRINNTDFSQLDFDSLVKEIKTKQWTHTRINRVLIHILLGLTKKNLDLYNQNSYCQYARLLGFNKNSSFLINELNKKSQIPIITKLNESYETLDDLALQMLDEDILATNIYNLIIKEKFDYSIDNEFRQGLIII